MLAVDDMYNRDFVKLAHTSLILTQQITAATARDQLRVPNRKLCTLFYQHNSVAGAGNADADKSLLAETSITNVNIELYYLGN